MAFANVLLPDTTTADMKGLFLLLDLFANPARAADAQAMLVHASTMRDEAQIKLDEAMAKLAEAVALSDATAARARDLDELAASLEKVKNDAKASKAEYDRRLATMKDWLKQAP